MLKNIAMKKILSFSLMLVSFGIASLHAAAINNEDSAILIKAAETGLQLPEGFTATEVATGLNEPRHIAVNANGNMYVKLGGLMNGKRSISPRP